ncbi:choice-of-anchor L domain-containing protein [Agaribacter marinus]|uniref:PEP-CTERM sorting domain-containing protein n=1 Tax=Agaribacter marinus TaxID=1431249 RepID=A0AA37T3T7_9ALTE|nr:choice-of-anchor L domain-containing protein [Agaribacter marinus]GLR72714.1 hypothetical protein GCM10007852_36220 [Agaribacter marinus]
MKKLIRTGLLTSCLFATTMSQAAILGLDLIETGDDAVADISSVFNSTDIMVVSGSEVFSGAQGTDIGAQSAIFSGVDITDGTTSLQLNEGFLLTTGSAASVGTTNTANNVSVNLGASGDADLEALATANGLNSNISNVNFFSFDFTLSAGLNAITLDFLFGTEEFPTQSVTDILGVFVDGVNFAFFADGSLVNNNGNPANFNNNAFGTAVPFDVEYNGLSDVLSVVGLVDETRTTHTLKIAIADTSDTIFDSGLFVGNLGATTATVGGIDPTQPVNAPATFLLMTVFGLFVYGRSKHVK